MIDGLVSREIQAAASEIHWAIDNAGQDVIIRQKGRDDTAARAYLYQTSGSGGATSLDSLDYKIMPWQGIFKPSAPVLGRHFIVVDESGRAFFPSAPTEDLGAQGVAYMAHLIPLERQKTHVLPFAVSAKGTVLDKKGNWIAAPASTLEVPVRLSHSGDPAIRNMVGADAVTAILVGRFGFLSEPSLRPERLGWGDKAPFEIDGERGLLTLAIAYPDQDPVREEVLGARFIATWQADR